jgi:putative sugar O-methyltransferase
VISSDYKLISKYWHLLNRKGIELLSRQGTNNFRQTVSQSYFTWLENLDGQYSAELYHQMDDNSWGLLQELIPLKEVVRKHDLFSPSESIIYNLVTAMLYYHVIQQGGGKYLDCIKENEWGNPPAIRIGGRSITQDMLNSILELMAISEGCNLKNVDKVVEVGAGSGRTAPCLLSIYPHLNYTIVDVPPALYLAKQFLTKSLPEASVRYIFPSELSQIQSADLFLAIDCLHEMTRMQVDYYFNQADRIAQLFYFKAWLEAIVPFDNIVYHFDKYPVRNSWEPIFNRSCIVPSKFAESLYRIK